MSNNHLVARDSLIKFYVSVLLWLTQLQIEPGLLQADAHWDGIRPALLNFLTGRSSKVAHGYIQFKHYQNTGTCERVAHSNSTSSTPELRKSLGFCQACLSLIWLESYHIKFNPWHSFRFNIWLPTWRVAKPCNPALLDRLRSIKVSWHGPGYDR